MVPEQKPHSAASDHGLQFAQTSDVTVPILRVLMINILKISADTILYYLFLIFPRKKNLTFHANCLPTYFFKKIGFDSTCKLSPEETICMKCQILFSGKNKIKYNYLLRRQFMCNVNSYFLRKIRKISLIYHLLNLPREWYRLNGN